MSADTLLTPAGERERRTDSVDVPERFRGWAIQSMAEIREGYFSASGRLDVSVSPPVYRYTDDYGPQAWIDTGCGADSVTAKARLFARQP